jgi:hypothetical protein
VETLSLAALLPAGVRVNPSASICSAMYRAQESVTTPGVSGGLLWVRDGFWPASARPEEPLSQASDDTIGLTKVAGCMVLRMREAKNG